MTQQEYDVIRYEVLDHRVLVVAVKGFMNDWAAYIGAVEGIDHRKEYIEVARNGTKLNFALAKLLFPDIAKRLKWRYYG